MTFAKDPMLVESPDATLSDLNEIDKILKRL